MARRQPERATVAAQRKQRTRDVAASEPRHTPRSKGVMNKRSLIRAGRRPAVQVSCASMQSCIHFRISDRGAAGRGSRIYETCAAHVFTTRVRLLFVVWCVLL